MAPIQSQGADVEVCPDDPSLRDDGVSKKPITAEEAMEIAIGESNTVEYTIDSDNSPYLEVRANVPNTDDPTLPINTFRMWFLGVVFTLVGAVLHQLSMYAVPTDLGIDAGRHGCQPILLDALSECYHHVPCGAAGQLPCRVLFRKGTAD